MRPRTAASIRSLRGLSLILVLVLATPAWAQAPTAKPKPCATPEYRHFDFWLGEWDVTNQQNERQSVNVITSAHGGCVVREEYSAGAYSGMSLNFYDQKTGKWYQTWIDNQGQPLFLSGGLEDGEMVLASDGAVKPIQRVTWSPNADGSVRQHWQSSKDGETWRTVFDGLYTKREARKKN